MRESVAIGLYSQKQKSIGDSFEQSDVDMLNMYWESLQNSIDIWDMTEARNKKQIEKKERDKDKEKVIEIEHEVFKKRRSIDFSEENWERFKQGKPLVLLKIFRPTRLDARNSVTLWDRKVYLVKKTADYQKSSLYHAYDVETGIHLSCGKNKEKLIKELKVNILKHEEEIYESIN